MRALGRIFLSIIFIVFGVFSAMNWDVSYTDLDAAIVNLQMYSGNFQFIGTFLDRIVNYTSLILALGIGFQVMGGVLVFFGVRQRLAAAFLAVYIISSTLIYYPFWFYEGELFTANLILFLKNLAMLGGIFLLFGGKGTYSSNYEMVNEDN